jgi:hypothetical protein
VIGPRYAATAAAMATFASSFSIFFSKKGHYHRTDLREAIEEAQSPH